MQRYKFESNSQHKLYRRKSFIRCVYLCKDTNLKAIHNILVMLHRLLPLCLPMQRYKFESNSQLLFLFLPTLLVVFTYAKIQIWKQFTTHTAMLIRFQSCVYLCKDTNLKAIHNWDFLVMIGLVVVFTYAKIQIWKQFTTSAWDSPVAPKLCLPMQRYKFESNSQQALY